MPDGDIKRIYELKCNEARYRQRNHPLRRGLKAIRAFEHRYKGHKIYSGGEWGGLHYLVYGPQEHWRESFEFAVSVAHITNIVGILHLDCTWGRWKMEQMGITYNIETEKKFCLETAKTSVNIFNHYAPDIPYEIFLHHEEDPYEACLFNSQTGLFEPFAIPLIPKN